MSKFVWNLRVQESKSSPGMLRTWNNCHKEECPVPEMHPSRFKTGNSGEAEWSGIRRGGFTGPSLDL